MSFCKTFYFKNRKYKKIKHKKEKPKDNKKKKKTVTYKGTSNGTSVNFSEEILQARRQWDDIFKAMREKNNKK